MTRVVAVTGASAGAGRAVARAFARRGDDVAVLARQSERLEDTRRELEALGRRGFAAGWPTARDPSLPYTPEIAAEAVVAAADNPRSDVLVGWPTLLALTANALLPGIVDRRLARTGYTAQQDDDPRPEHADNLFEPVELAVAAAGRFEDETRHRAVRISSPLARGALAVSAVATAAGLAVLGRFSKNGSG